MLNLVREGEEDYIEAIRYRRRLKIFENFLLTIWDANFFYQSFIFSFLFNECNYGFFMRI